MVATNCLVLLGGGYQTLTQLVTMALVRLADHPDQLALLRADPDLIDGTVDEVMRLDGSSQFVARHAALDVDLGGALIRRGQSVVVLLGAANLDPRQYPDPHRFDITRRQGRHLGFALGRHHCIGSVDAEQAARLAILGIIDRYPYLATSGAVWGSHGNTRAPSRLLLHLDPESAAADDHAIDASTRAWICSVRPPSPSRRRRSRRCATATTARSTSPASGCGWM